MLLTKQVASTFPKTAVKWYIQIEVTQSATRKQITKKQHLKPHFALLLYLLYSVLVKASSVTIRLIWQLTVHRGLAYIVFR